MGSGTVLDFETKNRYSLTITATDAAGGTDSADVTIEVLDLREAGVLDTVVIEVGNSGGEYGYETGAFGSLESGQFPGALFGDGNARAADQIYEDEDGYWHLSYPGGAANAWNGQERLNEISIDVTYEDGRDARPSSSAGSSRAQRQHAEAGPAPALAGLGQQGRRGGPSSSGATGADGSVQAAAITPASASPNSIVKFVSDTTPAGQWWPRT